MHYKSASYDFCFQNLLIFGFLKGFGVVKQSLVMCYTKSHKGIARKQSHICIGDYARTSADMFRIRVSGYAWIDPRSKRKLTIGQVNLWVNKSAQFVNLKVAKCGNICMDLACHNVARWGNLPYLWPTQIDTITDTKRHNIDTIATMLRHKKPKN